MTSKHGFYVSSKTVGMDYNHSNLLIRISNYEKDPNIGGMGDGGMPRDYLKVIFVKKVMKCQEFWSNLFIFMHFCCCCFFIIFDIPCGFNFANEPASNF